MYHKKLKNVQYVPGMYMYILQNVPKLEAHTYEIHKKVLPGVFNWVRDRLTSQVHPRLCLPHDGNHILLDKACEVRIGIKA